MDVVTFKQLIEYILSDVERFKKFNLPHDLMYNINESIIFELTKIEGTEVTIAFF
jgi:hypothetical protein